MVLLFVGTLLHHPARAVNLVLDLGNGAEIREDSLRRRIERGVGLDELDEIEQ
jgi:hypothetical protein